MTDSAVVVIARRIAAVVLLAGAALLGSVVLAPGTAHACSCMALAPESIVEQAPVVVVGTPVAVEESGTRARYRVEVDRSYKQTVPEVIVVESASSSAACGLVPELDTERVLVLGGPRGGGEVEETGGEADWADWSANLCWNLGSSEQILAHAGAPLAPTALAGEAGDGLSTGARAAIIAGSVGGLVALAAAGWLLVRRFR